MFFRLFKSYKPNIFQKNLSNIKNEITSKKIEIGFIGLGNMGKHMANNIINSYGKLNIYDVSKTATDYFADKKSVKIFKNIDELSYFCDVIVTMLPSCKEVKDVYLDERGILDNSRANLIAIDCSTINPFTSKLVYSLATEKNIKFIDAPVSGGTLAAENRNLTFMVGSVSTSDFEEVSEILKFMGSNFIHCGDVGDGQSTKICNNLLLAISMIGTSEVMLLGKRLGLDPKKLSSAINLSSGRCWSSEKYNPYPGIIENSPSSKGYSGGFGSRLMLKDLELAVKCIIDSKSTAFVGPLAYHLYNLHCKIPQQANEDFSSIIKLFSEDS